MADENPDGQKLEDLALNIQRVREQVAQLQARIERVRNEHRQLQRETFLRHKLYQWRKEEKQKIEFMMEEIKSDILFLRKDDTSTEIKESIQLKMAEARCMVDQFISDQF